MGIATGLIYDGQSAIDSNFTFDPSHYLSTSLDIAPGYHHDFEMHVHIPNDPFSNSSSGRDTLFAQCGMPRAKRTRR
jgi:hypothetical protein